jgi:long-chain acyl-CoA synthetase
MMNDNTESLVSLFFEQVGKSGNRVALREKVNGQYTDVSWLQFGQNVEALAGALIELGVERGDRTAIFSYNSCRWAYMDLASLAVGAIVVPIYFRSSAAAVEHILKDSGAKLVMVGDRAQLDAVLSVAGSLPDLVHIIGPDEAEADGAARGIIHGFDSCLETGAQNGRLDRVAERIHRIDTDDIATIVYTSGTTGEPKGAMLSHRSLIANVRSGMQVVGLTTDDVGLSFMPTSHVLDRCVVHFMNILAGGTVAYAESIETILADVQLVKPTAMCGVPRMFEKIYHAIYDNINAASGTKKALFNWAIGTGRKVVMKRRSDKKAGLLLRAKYRLADKMVYTKVRQLLGGRMRVFASGGAHLQEEIDIFFRAIGVPIMHGYGLTEATCTVTLNTFDDFMPGTLGHPYPGVEVAIAENGEILVKGDLIMQGYYNRPEESAATLAGGWLHTGDLGYLDDNGYLLMSDRVKDILVTSGGKNISPQRIETLLKLNRYVEQVAVIAESRNYVSALIVPDLQEVSAFCAREGIPCESRLEAIEREEVKELFNEIVESMNGELERFEQVKRFSLLPDEFTVESGELTSTLKVKRRVVDTKYRDLIESMYA